MTKYIFITGGVVSSLGKGIASASLASILENRGLNVTLLKLDPYINVDPGTMSPFQHGEVFVTNDGAETDLDLGHYERFVRTQLGKKNNFKPSAEVLAACEKYDKLIETSAVRLLRAARESVIKLEKYFRDIDLTLVDDNGIPIFHAKDLISNLEKMGKVVDGLRNLEEIVKKEEQAANTNRGGIEVNKYSM